jgi:hypothetical protein
LGKRSSFERRDRDFYSTPEAAVLPLIPHLPYGAMFIEPCAGDGRLVRHLEKHGMSCLWAFDIEPQHEDVDQRDALDGDSICGADPSADFIITNPPWRRDLMHPMIETFRAERPTWLLHDADWLFTKQAAPFLPYIRKIVTVGRVKWIEDSKMSGKTDAVWSLHTAQKGPTLFFGH